MNAVSQGGKVDTVTASHMRGPGSIPGAGKFDWKPPSLKGPQIK